jgi:uncharacterized protein (TIGR00251 family)
VSAWPWRWDGSTLILELQVQPRASRNEVVGLRDIRFKIRVSAAPVDGQANSELVKLLAREFRVSKSKVRIVKGAESRQKRVTITAPSRVPKWLEESSPSAAVSSEKNP